MCQQWRHSVSDLLILLRAGPLEKIIVRERLEASGLADGETTTLGRIVMDEVVAVFGNVRGNGCGGAVGHLNTKPIIKLPVRQGLGDVLVVWEQLWREVSKQRRAAVDSGEGGGEEIAVKVRPDVKPGTMIANRSQSRVCEPFGVSAYGTAGWLNDFASSRKMAVEFSQASADFAALCVSNLGIGEPSGFRNCQKCLSPCFHRIGFSGETASEAWKIRDDVFNGHNGFRLEEAGVCVIVGVYSEDNDPVACLRDAVVLGADQVVFGVVDAQEVPVTHNQRDQAVGEFGGPSVTARAVNGIDGILQVFEYSLEDSFLFALGSQQALHVFHDEDWRSVPGDNAEVLPIKEMASVSLICLAAELAYQFGAAHKRVGLAGGSK